MARPKAANKKPRHNLTLDAAVVEDARANAGKDGFNSLSELVEVLLSEYNKAHAGAKKSVRRARIERVANHARA